MHPLDFARSLSSPFPASMFGLGLCFVTAGGALAGNDPRAFKARVSLTNLVHITAMLADYGQPVEARTNRQCQDEAAAAWVAEAARKGPGSFPIDYQRLCRLASETHSDEASITIIVQAKSSFSCEMFKLSLTRFLTNAPGYAEHKSILYSEYRSNSPHNINIESSLDLVKRASSYFRVNKHSIDCNDGKYSVRFPRRAFYHIF